jgi:hypothetical protein
MRSLLEGLNKQAICTTIERKEQYAAVQIAYRRKNHSLQGTKVNYCVHHVGIIRGLQQTKQPITMEAHHRVLSRNINRQT